MHSLTPALSLGMHQTDRDLDCEGEGAKPGLIEGSPSVGFTHGYLQVVATRLRGLPFTSLRLCASAVQFRRHKPRFPAHGLHFRNIRISRDLFPGRRSG